MSEGTDAPISAKYSPLVYCTKCGRVTTRNAKDFPLWLIAKRVDDPAKLVSRCPQHITERTLIYAGRKRTKRIWRWVRTVKEKDPYKDATYSVANPRPLPESTINDWYEPGKLAPEVRRLSGVTRKQTLADPRRKRTA